MADLKHPYFPVDAVIPGYLPNNTPVAELIVTFGAIVGAVIGFSLWQTTRTAKPVRTIDKFAAAWFALCKSNPALIQKKKIKRLTGS
jgi:cholestenol Delta-isomerase